MLQLVLRYLCIIESTSTSIRANASYMFGKLAYICASSKVNKVIISVESALSL